LNGYTDKLSDFQGRLWHQDGKTIEVAGEDIREKVLCVGVPKDSITPGKQEVLAQCRDYAAHKDVKLIIEEVA